MAFGNNMGDLMQHAQEMQKKIRQVQTELKKRVVQGEAGGGMVKVFVNGQQEVMKLEIDKEVVDSDDVGMLEDLLLVAVKNGLEKSKELSKEEMGRVTGGLNIPGLF
ncbi:MAG: YbaB/EbfC family nucleoid-associated protein [Planctomycetota bacterium]